MARVENNQYFNRDNVSYIMSGGKNYKEFLNKYYCRYLLISHLSLNLLQTYRPQRKQIILIFTIDQNFTRLKNSPNSTLIIH